MKAVNSIKQKVIASILSIALLFSMIPAQVHAATVGTMMGDLKKTATRTAADEWEIELEFTPKGPLDKTIPYEVTIAVDSTSSLGLNGVAAIKSASIDMINNIYKMAKDYDLDINLNLLIYGSSEKNQTFTVPSPYGGDMLVTDKTSKVIAELDNIKLLTLEAIDAIVEEINSFTFAKTDTVGTNIDLGLQMADRVFDDVPPENGRQVLILLSDGQPNMWGDQTEQNTTYLDHIKLKFAEDAAKASANVLKTKKVEIYTIGYHSSNSEELDIEFLKELSSDASGKNTFEVGVGFDLSLGEVFNKIINQLKFKEVGDIMGLHFDLATDVADLKMLVNGTAYGTFEFDTLTKRLKWTPPEDGFKNTEKHTLKYKVKVDPKLAAGAHTDYETNGKTEVSYDVYDNSYEQEFTSPKVNFNIAQADVEVSGLPPEVDSSIVKLVGPNKIITGFVETPDDIKDTFKVDAPIIEHNGHKYIPTVTYGINDGALAGLPVDKDGHTYTIEHFDMGSGTYTFHVTYVKQKEYLVRFDNNDGAGTINDQHFYYDEAQHLTTNTFTKEHHEFAGWATTKVPVVTAGVSASEVVEYTDAQSVINLTDVDGGTVTLYAVWIADETFTYTVNHELEQLGGGYQIEQTQTLQDHAGVVVEPPVNDYVGYTQPDLKKGTVTADSSLVITYQYNLKEYTVDFESNGGSAVTSQTVKHGDTAKKETPTKAGFDFAGWYTDDGEFFHEYDFDIAVTENITLYAKWVETRHKVTFHANGSDIEVPNMQIVKDGETATDPNTESTATAWFLGWSTSESLEDPYRLKFDFSTGITEDTDLYAIWVPFLPAPTYTVTYNDGVDTEQIFADETYINLSDGDATPAYSGVPTRAGYTFEGWSPEIKARVTGDATYVAKWKPITYYNIEIQIEGNGTVSPNGGDDSVEKVEEGAKKAFSMTPDSSWYIDDVLVDGVSVGKLTSYEFENIQKNYVIKVIFKKTEVPPTTGPIGPTPSPAPTAQPTPPSPTDIPKTGDSSSIMVWLLFITTSGLSFFVVGIMKNKKQWKH